MARTYDKTTRARSTGAEIQTCSAESAGMVPDDGAWVNVCWTHGGIVHHETLALARSWASCPEQWCEGCYQVKNGGLRELAENELTARYDRQKSGLD